MKLYDVYKIKMIRVLYIFSTSQYHTACALLSTEVPNILHNVYILLLATNNIELARSKLTKWFRLHHSFIILATTVVKF